MALCQPEQGRQYRAIALANIPQFLPESATAILHGVEENYQREHSEVFVSKLDNEARRLIALVDECYERGVLLLCTADSTPEHWYQASQLSFAFERTVSRLYEMQRWDLAKIVGAHSL
jgi:cell division protein ZapE